MDLPNPRRSRSLPMLLLAAALAVSGCVGIAESVATRLAEKSVKRQELLALVEGDVALYHHCLKARGGACEGDASTPLPQSGGSGTAIVPADAALGDAAAAAVARLPAAHPARTAAAALTHPALDNAVQLHNHLRGHPAGPTADFQVSTEPSPNGPRSNVEVSVSLDGTRSFLETLHRATLSGGWSALADETSLALARSKNDGLGHRKLRRDHRRAVFVRDYLKAYFRNGRFVAIDFKIDATEAQSDLSRELGRHSRLSCDVFNAARAAVP